MTENKSPSQRWGAPLPIWDETPQFRRQRILAGAVFGLLGGSAFALFSGTIDALTHPDLPIYIDWATTLMTWLWLGSGMTIVGIVTAWAADNLKGIGSGAALMALTTLIVSIFYQSSMPAMARVVSLIILALPISAVCIPIAWTLRGLVTRAMLLSREKSGAERLRGSAFLLLLAFALGALPSIFVRASGKAENALRVVDTQLQNARLGQYESPFGLPVEKMPVLKAHLNTDYRLIQRSSRFSAEGFDVTIIFADNYKVTCVLVAPGSQKPYLSACREGQ
jgi:hypothetical protein